MLPGRFRGSVIAGLCEIMRCADWVQRSTQILRRIARFWQRVAQAPLNERQTKVLNRLLDGFDGKFTTTKWARMTKVSHDTALRDIKDLIERGLLIREEGGGRSTSYALVFED